VRRRLGRYLFTTVRLFVLVNTNDRTTGTTTTTTTRGGGGNLWRQWRQPRLVARLAKGILVVKKTEIVSNNAEYLKKNRHLKKKQKPNT
jgi:hypothetical protein